MPRQYPGYSIDPSMATRMAAQLRQEPTYPTGGGTVGSRSLAFNSSQPVDNSASTGQNSGGTSQMQQLVNQEAQKKMMDYAASLRAGGATSSQIGNASQYYGPEVAKMGGNVGMTANGSPTGGGFMSGIKGGISNLFGGGPSGAGGGSAGAGGGGMMSNAGGLGALALASWLGDKEMNENKGSIINADKLNRAGTLGKSGIGLRFGDFANGFNPATWMSDPKKAAKGLGNAFTFGLLDKVI